ncbi:hypothetical protein [Bacillus sp. PS06]|uniref:hypothetical protein n=1 Tax=Bacillus sp. PS06 TaxID=2764176 RepID=UPI0017846DDC|nr:hypothetical protein [Bacillus sp. PS06]MBD8068752.1 hypothetical protein [Bacillus sp. PS06]
MKIDTLNVRYIINGKISVLPTKLFYCVVGEDEWRNIHLDVRVMDQDVQSKASDSIEMAIKYLQRELPEGVHIACCQSCRHGHFNPYGDNENEIFCLNDQKMRSKEDVVEYFSTAAFSLEEKSRKLLDYCEKYDPICGEKSYTYNDW